MIIMYMSSYILHAHTCNDVIVIHFENPESWLVDIRRPSDVDYIRCEGVRYSVMVDSITTIYAYLNRVCWIRNEIIGIEEEHKRILSIGSQYTLESVCL